MDNSQELKNLVAKLRQQVDETAVTVKRIAEIAQASDDHQLKFYALTALSSQHFGLTGLPQAVEKLANRLNNKE